jgi:hypothetical protein
MTQPQEVITMLQRFKSLICPAMPGRQAEQWRREIIGWWMDVNSANQWFDSYAVLSANPLCK